MIAKVTSEEAAAEETAVEVSGEMAQEY